MWRSAALIALCSVVLAACAEAKDGGPVETAVVRAYPSYAHHRALHADCEHADDNADGTEWWWCDVDMSTPSLDDTDICTVDVRRHASGAVTVTRFVYCFSVDGP